MKFLTRENPFPMPLIRRRGGRIAAFALAILLAFGASTAAAFEVIVDDADVTGSKGNYGFWMDKSGRWTTENNGAAYATPPDANSHHVSTNNDPQEVRWYPVLGVGNADDYAVYIHWVAAAGRDSNITVRVKYNNGNSTSTSTINQRNESGDWYLLGTFGFSGSNKEYVELIKPNSVFTASADAVRFVKVEPNAPPVGVNDAITVNEGATVTVLSNPAGQSSVLFNDTDADGDALTATAPIINVLHGTLTLNPDGTFSYTHDGGETVADSFTYKAWDGNAHSNSATVAITINPVNDPPVAAAEAITVAEGGTATTLTTGGNNLLANDTDVDGGPLSAILVGNAGHGNVTVNGDGTFSYVHDGSETVADSFSYKANDGAADSNVVTVTVTITPVNDPPVAVADSLTVAEGGSGSILSGGAGSVLANDSDAEGDAITAILVANPANGSVTLNPDGTFTYTHDGSETAADSFTYKASDGSGESNIVPVTVTVTPVNDAPAAVADALTVAEGGTATTLDGGVASVLANDSDADGDPLTAVLVTNVNHGSLTLNADGTFNYIHDGSETAADSFTYKANDGTADSNVVTVTVTVTPVNDPPVAQDDAITVNEGENATVLVGGAVSLLANDSDAENDPLTPSLVGNASNGAVAIHADGTFSYTHNGGETTSGTFTYKVNDGTSDSNIATVAITIVPVNDAPLAAADAITVAEGGTVTTLDGGGASVLANDTDAEGDVLAAILLAGPAHGAVTLNPDGTFSYTHDGGETVADSFTYKANDGAADSNVVTVTITILPANDPPVATADALTVAEGGTAATLDGGAASVLTNDSDADGDPLTAVLVTDVTHGTLTLNADGSFSYTHDGSETISDFFTYKANDGTADSVAVRVSIAVTPVNDAPVATADTLTVAEGGTATSLDGGAGSVLANDSDADGDALTAILVTNVSHGSLTLNPNGTFSYTHDGGETAADSFTYKANDGNADSNVVTVAITVTPTNDAPVAVADAMTVVEGGTTANLDGGAASVLANDSDADGDPLTAVLVANVNHGSLTLNADGTFNYIHDGSETAADSFSYKASDGTADSNVVTVSITVNLTNDPPVAVADALTVAEGGTATTLDGGAPSVLANDNDADGDPLTAILVADVAHGSLTLNADGSFSYSHDGGETAADSFTYKANDGITDSGVVTVTIAVTPVNDPPAGAADALTVAEGGTATTLDGGGATVLANDSDPDGDPLTAVLVGNPAHGSLTLNADGTFSYTHDGSETVADSFTYKANDGAADSAPVTVTVTVTPVNDPPVANGEYIHVVPGGTTTTLTSTETSVLVNDTDAEGDPLTALLVVDVASGTLVLNVDGTFSYTHDGGAATTDSFIYKANDGTADSNDVKVVIAIDNDNVPPVAIADSLTVAEGGNASTLSGGAASVLANDRDVEGDALTAVLVTDVGNGVLVFNPDGTFTYTHDGGETASDSFTYKANDGQDDSDPVTVSITVTPVNDPPVAVADALTVAEGGTATTLDTGAATVLANDADPDGDPLTAILVADVAHGSLTLNANGTFSYSHDGSETAADSFTYKANDGTDDSGVVTVSITVTPANDPPVATADAITVAEAGTANTLDGGGASVLANDTDAEGDGLTAILVSDVAHGVLVLNADGTFSYSHDGSETIADSFTYKANDGTADSGVVTVSITVTPANDPPVATADALTVVEAGTAMVLDGGAATVLANDTDAENDALTATLVADVAHGTLTLNADGTFSYTHDGGETAADSFTYKANDGTDDSIVVTVSITVTSINDPPVATADALTVAEGSSTTTLDGGAATVLANDSDAENDALTAILVDDVTHGTLTLNADGTFSYTHDGGETATDSFTYKANDGTDDSNVVTVSITVTPVNDPPVATADALTVAEGSSTTTLDGGGGNLLSNDTDAEGDALTAILVADVAHGSLTLNADGTFSYTHDGGETAADSFTYKANDGTDDSNVVTVSITVTPVNDPPVATADALTVAEGGTVAVLEGGNASVLANDTDAEGDALTATLVADVTHGTLTLNGDGTFSYTHDGGETAADSFTYKANDGTDDSGVVTVSITITPVNDPPVATADAITVDEGGTATVLDGGGDNLLNNDTDAEGDPLTAVLVADAAHGAVSINPDGTFSYSHDGGETIADSFTYKANDGTDDSGVVTVTITINPVNDPPVATAESITVDEGGTATVLDGGAASVLANDTDAEGDVLTAILVADVSHGSLTLNADGSFSYSHDGGETIADSFTYKANDGAADSDVVTVAITINPVNDPPVAVAESITVDEGATATVLDGGGNNLLANDSDAESDALTAVLVADGGNGTATILPDGTFSYTHDGSETIADSFTYKANDGTADSNVVTVTITVNPVNDPPTAVDDAYTILEDSGANTFDVLANDIDPDLVDSKTILSVDTTGTVGGVAHNGAVVVYTPPADYFGVDTFTYTMEDIEHVTSTATVTITVQNVNDAPVAVADSISANRGATATILMSGATSVLANDTDADGDALSAVLVSTVSHGVLVFNGDGTFSYTHDGGASESDSFTYRASDGQANSNVVTVQIYFHEVSGHTIDDFTSYPLNLTDSVAPLVMIAASNDHQLYFKAYNDYSDLDGDNIADTTFKPNIVYYGYFDSYKCYDYDAGQGRFEPAAVAGAEYYMLGTVTGFVPASGQVTFTVTGLSGVAGLGPYNDWTITNLTTGATGTSTTPTTLAAAGSKTMTTTAEEWLAVGANIQISTTVPSYCTGSNDGYWSGNFLNWISMSRIDTIRKILFGGHRRVDSAADTVLERAYLPHDAHSWAKHYGGSDLEMLTPFSTAAGHFTLTNADAKQNGITFCNTTDKVASASNKSEEITDPPLIKVAKGNYSLWAGNERWQCTWDSGAAADNHAASNGNSVALSGIDAYSASPAYAQGLGQKNYIARVQACVPGLLGRERCKQYPAGNYKPIGLLQVYGDDDQLLFGMVAGTYHKHVSGGSLFKNIESITDEINVATDGTFRKVAVAAGGPEANNQAYGIINDWSLLRMVGYNHGDGTYMGAQYDNCSWGLSAFANVSGANECKNWGNPFSEIFLQSVRYYSDAGVTGTYQDNASVGITGLPTPQNWANPNPLNANNYCARANIVAFNSSTSSYDFDELDANSPGVGEIWNAATLPGNDTSAAMTDIIGEEEGIHGNQYFIGEVNVDNQADGEDQLCTAKTVTSLGNLGGLCPESPRLRGSYRVAGIAYYAHIADVRASYLSPARRLDGTQKIDTYAVSSATAVPEIGIPHPITGGDAVKILPACRNTSLNPAGNCALVDFKIVSQTVNNGSGIGSGKFYVNWEDSEQGGDYDQDMWGIIEYTIDGNTNTLTITTDVHAESTIYKMGFGYILSGTTSDGFHVHSGIENFSYGAEARLTAGNDCRAACNVGNAASTATYSLGASLAELLEEPLWYAAKWGNFQDSNGNNIPDLPSEWDSQDTEGNPVPDGIPDNYFYATNPRQLEDSLNRVFLTILKRTSSGTAAAVVSNNVRGEGALYQAYYEPMKQDAAGNTATWAGTLHGLWLDRYGYMREDDGDAILGDYSEDKVIETFFDGAENRTRVRRHISSSTTEYAPFFMEGTVTAFDAGNGTLTFTVTEIGGSDGDGPYTPWVVTNLSNGETGDSTTTVLLADHGDQTFTVTPASPWIAVGDTVRVAHQEYTTIELDEVRPIWNAREQLYFPLLTDNDIKDQRVYGDPASAGRFIKTWLDIDGDGVVDAGEYVDFTEDSITYTNYAHFDLGTESEVEGIVNYLRGVEIGGYRSRVVDYDGDGDTEVMRLGDIVNSTPTWVGPPVEAFDLLYRDDSYSTFRVKYRTRRNVLYVGANDGMLHAFNAGFFDPVNVAYSVDGLKPDGVTAAAAHPLGSELWAYVPMNLQPHLKWLKDPEYTHVSYVDAKPRVFDAKIFTAGIDPVTGIDHPNGWGTVLVAGMRFGGGAMTIDTAGNGLGAPNDADDRTRRSAYAIFDVTDPESAPNLLGEIQLPDGTFTTVYPAILTFKDRVSGADANKWFLVFGSGPNSFTTGQNTGTAKLYVLDLAELGAPGTTTAAPTGCTLSTLGTAIKVITCDSGVANSFVGTPMVVDWDLDYKADTSYFGIIGGTGGTSGRLMRFTLDEDPIPANWTAPATLIDVAQPVYAPPTAAVDSDNPAVANRWVFFGSGRLLVQDDKTSAATQSLYGLVDDDTLVTLAELEDVTDIEVETDGDLINGPVGISTFDDLESSIASTRKGWKLDLPPITGTAGVDPATRMLNQQALLGGILFSSVYQPSVEACTSEGLSRLYGLYFRTGTALPQPSVFGTYTDPITAATYSLRYVDLGFGLATSPAIHSGSGEGDTEVSVFTQLSTGTIIRQEAETKERVRSGKKAWRER
ncbi:MAG: Ig-like domain-containing protein [Thermodesulfobacteriota bacterium]